MEGSGLAEIEVLPRHFEHAVSKLVGALRCKPEGRGFDYRRSQGWFSRHCHAVALV